MGGILTTADYPDDADTTALACMVSDHLSRDVKNDIMDEILTLRNKDGIIQTYFDVTRPRFGTFFRKYHKSIPVHCASIS